MGAVYRWSDPIKLDSSGGITKASGARRFGKS